MLHSVSIHEIVVFVRQHATYQNGLMLGLLYVALQLRGIRRGINWQNMLTKQQINLAKRQQWKRPNPVIHTTARHNPNSFVQELMTSKPRFDMTNMRQGTAEAYAAAMQKGSDSE